jgi:hypothetical protein
VQATSQFKRISDAVDELTRDLSSSSDEEPSRNLDTSGRNSPLEHGSLKSSGRRNNSDGNSSISAAMHVQQNDALRTVNLSTADDGTSDEEAWFSSRVARPGYINSGAEHMRPH